MKTNLTLFNKRREGQSIMLVNPQIFASKYGYRGPQKEGGDV